MASKWKKRLGKAAALAAGIYGATRFGKARKKKALNAITAGDIARSNYQIPDTDMGGSPPVVDTPPVNKRKEWRHGNRTGKEKRGWDDSFLNIFSCPLNLI